MKKVIAILLTSVLVFCLVACTKQGATEKDGPGSKTTVMEPGTEVDNNKFIIQPKNGDKYVVGIVVKTLESAFYQNMANAVKDVYGDSDTFEVIVQASKTETDTAGFIQIIEDMITKDVDCLVVVPGDPNAVAPTLENVVAAGIPVICSETDVPNLEGKLTYIGIDNVAAGKSVVQYVFDQGLLVAGDECAVITGPVGYTTATDRAKGAKDGIEANGGVLVSEQPANWDRTKGMEVAENIITANPNLKAIFASNGEMALGSAEAVASAGKTAQIFITGFDGILDEYYAIQDGRLIATALQDSRQYSLLAMEKYIDYLKGKPLDPFYDIGSPVVTKDNVAEYMAQSSEG